MCVIVPREFRQSPIVQERYKQSKKIQQALNQAAAASLPGAATITPRLLFNLQVLDWILTATPVILSLI
jgi:hypothetical protein